MSTRAPSPRFARVLHETASHPKFIGDAHRPPLNAVDRGTWVTALVLADIAFPNAIHESAVRLQCPGADFTELYERNLLERTDDPGWFHVHDLDEIHRRPAPSDAPEAVRERVRAHRARKRAETTVTEETTNETNETIRDEIDNRVDSPERTQARGARGRATQVRGFARPFEATT